MNYFVAGNYVHWKFLVLLSSLNCWCSGVEDVDYLCLASHFLGSFLYLEKRTQKCDDDYLNAFAVVVVVDIKILFLNS